MLKSKQIEIQELIKQAVCQEWSLAWAVLNEGANIICFIKMNLLILLLQHSFCKILSIGAVLFRTYTISSEKKEEQKIR